MKIEVLYSDDCPNHEAARERVERILARRALAVPVALRRIESVDAAQGTAFLGSPTVLVNGKDVDVARRNEAPAFGCRTYESVQEGRSPLPPLSWLEAAIAVALVEEGAEVGHCAAAPPATVRGNCPACGEKGKAVWHVTLESLLTPECLARLGPEEHLCCPSPTCEVVYFAPATGRVFERKDLLVRVGTKEAEPPRPVCYCFGHTVEMIEHEIRRTGRSTTVKEITDAMKGGCRCEIVRPQSTCCLGDVTRAAQEAQRKLAPAAVSAASSGDADADRCCPTDPAGRQTGGARTGLLAAAASVVSAVVASACCWLPLLLVAMGVSAGGVSAAFETVRPYFLAGASVLLAAGYYFVFFRRAECAGASACSVPNRRVERLNKGMLILATALVLAIAFFPSYVGALVGAGQPSPATAAGGAPARLEALTLKIEGMTCEGCTVHIRNALAAVPGVRSTEVRYADGTAIVRYDPDSPPAMDALVKAIKTAGYHVSTSTGVPQ